MIDRLLALLDRPVDPRAGRAVMALAAAITLGFAALFVLTADSAQRQPPSAHPLAPKRAAPLPPSLDGEDGAAKEASPRPPSPRPQDPQDDRGSAAARGAQKELQRHRALQHVPYKQGGLTVTLIGARQGRALLRVSAPTPSAARRGWRQFLRRFGDTGLAYVPLFRPRGGAAGRRGSKGRS
jgi:hypothetical protein